MSLGIVNVAEEIEKAELDCSHFLCDIQPPNPLVPVFDHFIKALFQTTLNLGD